MANKYVEWSDTDQTMKEVEATTVSAGAGDSGKIVALNASGEIDPTMLPVSDVKNLPSGENLTAGDFVYVDSSGDVRKASGAAAGNPSIGYVRDSVVSPANVNIYFEGVNASLAGLTTGDEYFLSDTTPGGVTNTAPVGANKIIQSIGNAISATEIVFEPARPVKRA